MARKVDRVYWKDKEGKKRSLKKSAFTYDYKAKFRANKYGLVLGLFTTAGCSIAEIKDYIFTNYRMLSVDLYSIRDVISEFGLKFKGGGDCLYFFAHNLDDILLFLTREVKAMNARIEIGGSECFLYNLNIERKIYTQDQF